VPADGAGLFVVRAWLEPASERPLRAKVRYTRDVSQGMEHEATTSDADEVAASLEHWLSTLAAASDGDAGS
jgi:hypothetical protein